MKIKLNAMLASMREPYWWVRDTQGFRRISIFDAYIASKDEVAGVWIVGLIVGPLHLQLGIAS